MEIYNYMEQFKKLNSLILGQKQVANATIVDPLKDQMKHFNELNRENIRRREEERLANIETAENTAEMRDDIKIVIHNQNKHIALLEEQLGIQKEQLQVLKDIFSSTENELEIEWQLKELVRQQIDKQHPLWDYVKDKGTDVAIAAAPTATPVLVNAFKTLLHSMGIL